MTTLKIKKFDINKIKQDSNIFIYGRRNTGKSYLARNILFSQSNNISKGIVITSINQPNKFYDNIVPTIKIYENNSPQLITSFIKEQRLTINKIREQEKDKQKPSIYPSAFLIIDDCIYDCDKDLNNLMDEVKDIFMNGRNLRILYIHTFSFDLPFPPSFRANNDYIFIFREISVNIRRRLYKIYGGIFPTFEVFMQVMDQLTNDNENLNECLVIDNRCNSNNIEDCIFWYKASYYSNVIYDEGEDEDEEEDEEIETRNLNNIKEIQII